MINEEYYHFFKKLPHSFKIPNVLYFKLACFIQLCLTELSYILMHYSEMIIVTVYKINILYLRSTTFHHTKTLYKVCLYTLPEKSMLFLTIVPCDKQDT